ncbi:MFS transporter [Streptomyces sp. NPDC003247]|uniref:MFS transporter n=1 Tax=Streptomyces sp. NPDC003247 TaxID=3364677 RepID=UPI003696601E
MVIPPSPLPESDVPPGHGPSPDSADEAQAPAVPPAPLSFLVFYVCGYGGLMMAAATPTIVTLALRAQEIAPQSKASVLSLVLLLGTVSAAVANPVVGALSDRTTSRFGMRRPWLLGGSLAGIAGTLLVALLPSVGGMVLGWCLAQLGFNAVFAALYAVMADRIAPQQRGKVSGFIGVSQSIGTMCGTWIASLVTGSVLAMFVIPPLVALVCVGALALRLPDRRLRAADRDTRSLGKLASSFLVNPRKHPDFAWAWLGRLLIMIGYAFFGSYQLYFLTDHLRMSATAATGVVAAGTTIGTMAQLVSSPVGGWLSDRSGRRKAFVTVGSLLFAAGMLVIAFSTNSAVFLTGVGLASFAFGLYLAVDLALVTDVLPDNGADAAKDLGILAVASTLGLSLGPALVPALLAVFGDTNYQAVFVIAAVCMVIGALTLKPIKGVR